MNMYMIYYINEYARKNGDLIGCSITIRFVLRAFHSFSVLLADSIELSVEFYGDRKLFAARAGEGFLSPRRDTKECKALRTNIITIINRTC